MMTGGAEQNMKEVGYHWGRTWPGSGTWGLIQEPFVKHRITALQGLRTVKPSGVKQQNEGGAGTQS